MKTPCLFCGLTKPDCRCGVARFVQLDLFQPPEKEKPA